MSAAYDVVPFSELLHKPGVTAGRLDRVRALRLRRRDAGDLALMRVEQLDAEGAVVDFTSRMLAGLVRRLGSDAVRDVLPDALPWVTFLPDTDVDRFVSELVEVAQGAAALENLAPFATLLTQWRHTAEIHADPALLEMLTRGPEGDLGPVPVPDEPGGGE
ncbi:hypothetical protein HLB23_23845 [Nocardia uniformis]|uniref:Uncharacterized protein n=1 Tax=Nocardia uniformis TaxID=53432 RepID=A0A849C288_9NOCA|nr:hypothetical protein [Nocardia uniformis]NNH72853.1 hypothetical protein [Nocardia uniformis]